MRYILIIILIISLQKICNAEIGKETGLKIPRYISLKSNEANIRVGPSKNYPILLKYIKKNLPLKVIDEHEDWRRVKDFNNNIGWIHKSLISGNRTGIIFFNNDKEVKIINNTLDETSIGLIGNGNIVLLSKCKLNSCYISIDSYKGWVNKKNIWGVNENEIFKIRFYQLFIDYYWQSINFLKKMIYEK